MIALEMRSVMPSICFPVVPPNTPCFCLETDDKENWASGSVDSPAVRLTSRPNLALPAETPPMKRPPLDVILRSSISNLTI